MNTGMPQQGTIPSGTTIQIGTCIVVIDRYIAEGGFAHVYLATLTHEMGLPVVSVPVPVPVPVGFPDDGPVPVAPLPVVVKRIAVPDKERLAIVIKEIDTMKSLGKHKNIVQYYNSCIGKLVGGGYEILILMEYCGGGPVIDLMNRRLQVRLTEPEILKIFSNVCEAVAFLHYSNPPILHRDIKVENILLSGNDYKLCDFGSATTNILRGDRIPTTAPDIQLLEEEINNYTTLQYRAPEMLELYMRRGIDEKIDIWALGVLLYKLCFYTTPFEGEGQLAIVNVRYRVPDSDFSPGLINIFRSILKEDPRQRPTIYQVMLATSTLRGLPCPIPNKYLDMPYTPPAPDSQQSVTANILTSFTATRPTTDFLPSIEPMRRGRPTRPSTVASVIQQNGVQDAFQTPPSQNNFNHGFDDSFGEFSTTTDSAPQFSKFPSAGDTFSFENDAPSQSKRFTLTHATKDDFGFDFSNVESKDPSPAASSSSATAPPLAPRPRPPSFGSSDFVQSESLSPTHRSSAMNPSPIQFSGATLSAKNPIADQLFAPVNTGSQSSGMTKPLLPPQQVSQISGQPLQPVRPSATKGLPTGSLGTAASDRGLRSTIINNTGMTLNDNPKRQEEPSEPTHPFERLHRQQMEQLNRFSVASTSAQNAQGKPLALDPSKTLDGMKSHDMNLRMNMVSTGSGATPGLGSIQPPLAPRPQVAPLASPAAQTGAPPLDKKEIARKDLESELRLLDLQQKDFEKQRHDLVVSQRRELEEQQQLHLAQQEQLQKRQHNQMQLQHEKWLERNRTMGEEEQLTEQQFQQQRELRKRHDDQQQLQLQLQQQQRLPDISNAAASVASISLTTTDRDILAATGQQKRLPQEQSPERSLLPVGTGQRATVIYPSAVMIGSRPTTVAINGTGASTLTLSTASTASSLSPVMSSSTTGATKARRVSVGNLPTGQKPDPMPKPPRFSMKNGTGTPASGEEEAFSRRFPSIHLEGDSTQHQQRGSMFVQSPSTSQGSNRTTQYMSPSQRAQPPYDEEEEEEEERLVRNRNGQSARQTVVDPRQSVVSPRQTVVSPRQTVVDPRQTIVSPRQTVVDQRQTFASPRQTVVDQRQTFVDQRQTVVDQRQTFVDQTQAVVDATDEPTTVKERIARAERMNRIG